MHLLHRVQVSVKVTGSSSQGGRNSIGPGPPRINLRLLMSITVNCLNNRSWRSDNNLRDPHSKAVTTHHSYRQCRGQENG